MDGDNIAYGKPDATRHLLDGLRPRSRAQADACRIACRNRRTIVISHHRSTLAACQAGVVLTTERSSKAVRCVSSPSTSIWRQQNPITDRTSADRVGSRQASLGAGMWRG